MTTRQHDQHCDAGATEFQKLINSLGPTEHKVSDNLSFFLVGFFIKYVTRPTALQF